MPEGSAEVSLTEDGDGSLLSYRVSSQVSGKIAQLGARLVDSAAQKLAGDFFAAFNNSFQQTVAGAPLLSAAPAPPARDDLRSTRRISRRRWFLGLAAGTSALLVLIWFSSR